MSDVGNKVSVSMPASLYEAANARRISLRYRSFSAYVQHLIETDLETGGSHVRNPVASPTSQPLSTTESSATPRYGGQRGAPSVAVAAQALNENSDPSALRPPRRE